MTRLAKTAMMLLATAMSAGAVTAASAQSVVYSSFTAHGKHDDIGPFTIGTAGSHPGYLPNGYIALAASFVPGASGTLDHMDLALGQLQGLPAATITLVTDNGSGAPNLSGPVLETIIASKLPADNGSRTKNTLVRSVAKPALTGGTTYWILVTTAAYDGLAFWYQSDSATQRVIYTADGGQTFNGYTSHQAAFDVWVAASGN